MKTPFSRFVLCLTVAYLTYVVTHRAIAAPLPPAEDVCGVINSKHIDNFNYAKILDKNLNLGESRTVRLIYFLPNDRSYRAEVVQRMKDEVLKIQTFYTEAMRVHGYDMTFKIEMDAQGEPVVHRVDGQQPDSDYIVNTSGAVIGEVQAMFDVRKNIYFIVIDNSINAIGRGINRRAQGVGYVYGKSGGTVLIAGDFKFKTAAHELGHTFGLQHDFRDGTYIMSYGQEQNQLSVCNADFLTVHPYFNPDIPTERGQLPTIELISPLTYPTGSESVDIQLKLTDLDGIHQVILFVKTINILGPVGFLEIKSCHKLTGEKEIVVNFKYDGDIPSSNFISLPMFTSHSVRIAAIDVNGDVRHSSFTLSEVLPEQSQTTSTVTTISRMDGDYQTWGIPDGMKLRLGKGGAGEMDNAVAFSPDSQYLAVSSDIGIWLYNATTYQELALLQTSDKVSTLAFSPDSRTIVSGAGGNWSEVKSWELNLWDVVTKEKIATFGWGRESVAFSPDGKIIASGETILWDAETRQQIAVLNNGRSVNSMSFSPDGNLLACGVDDNTVKLWDVNTAQNVGTFQHKAKVNSVAFSPDGKTIASGSDDATVKLWDVATGTEIIKIQNRRSTWTVTFSPDGKTLAWVSFGQTILWDIATRTKTAIFEESGNSIVFSPDGKNLICASHHRGIVKLWNIETGNAVDLGHTRIDNWRGNGISFSHDSTIIASGTYDGTIRLWDVETGQNIGNLLGVRQSLPRIVVFSPDGRTIASRATKERVIRLWDIVTQTTIAKLEGNSITTLAFSPDGSILASATVGASDYKIKLWDVATRQNNTILEGHTDKIRCLAFSPDGMTLASGADDDKIKLWDIETQQNIATFTHAGEYGMSIWSLTFLDDGKKLASWVPHILHLGSIKLWDVPTQTLITTFDLPPIVDSFYEAYENFSTVYSTDGTMMLKSFYGTFSLWDTSTLKLIATLKGFCPNERIFASTRHDTILLGDIESLNSHSVPSAPASIKLTNALQTELLSNYPNPFNPETWIPFRLAEDADVTLTIYDVSGKEVRSLDIGHSKAGVYESRDKAIYWDGKNDLGESVASGVYFYHLSAGDYKATKQMVILK